MLELPFGLVCKEAQQTTLFQMIKSNIRTRDCFVRDYVRKQGCWGVRERVLVYMLTVFLPLVDHC